MLRELKQTILIKRIAFCSYHLFKLRKDFKKEIMAAPKFIDWREFDLMGDVIRTLLVTVCKEGFVTNVYSADVAWNSVLPTSAVDCTVKQ
jgi:hypothetical protein